MEFMENDKLLPVKELKQVDDVTKEFVKNNELLPVT
ncbi:hypothetical protein A2U01_0083388, partial [Trifolium medium]|nr:hypothetical protein [Trifolium medium]